jgi:VanZ family protein
VNEVILNVFFAGKLFYLQYFIMEMQIYKLTRATTDEYIYSIIAMWRACNLTAFLLSLTGPVMRDLGSIPTGVLT